MTRSPLLLFHISAGLVGLLSGAAAMTLRKGSHRHRVARQVFVISMLCMSGVGVYLAFVKSQLHNVFGGALTFYLVATAWMTARRREGESGVFDWVALLVVLAVGAVIVTYGIDAAKSPTGTKGGIPAGMYFFLAFVALLSASGDVRMLVRGGVFGAPRIARHLWRMCFALLIASGSLFLGRPHAFPEFFRTAHILEFLTFLPLVLMIFWLARVSVTESYPKQRQVAGGSEPSLAAKSGLVA